MSYTPNGNSPNDSNPENTPNDNTIVRNLLGPLAIMLSTPVLIVVFFLTCTRHDGSLLHFFSTLTVPSLLAEWPRPSLAAAAIIFIFAAVQALLLVALPGKRHLGPVTPTGNRPSYKLNGIPAFFVTLLLFYLGAYPLHWFSPGIVYDHFGAILTTLTLFALGFCGFLYLKGIYFPSSSDAGRSGHFVFDFYWGVELHPQLGGAFNLKQFINCRVGMMCWPVILVSFAAKQAEIYGHASNSMLVSVGLQLVYIAKFYYWESGYFGSLDIMHDRFGYYICWGVLCWIPGVYTLTGFYLINHPIDLPMWYAVACVVLGLVSIWINYAADAQRQRLRETNGNCTIWGKPPETIAARYTTSASNGDRIERENLLLVSGWWGVARHFHYVPEIALSLAWSLPALATHFIPYFYVVYLALLLWHRAGRDEGRCQKKYGESWDAYRRRVPYRIIPLVY